MDLDVARLFAALKKLGNGEEAIDMERMKVVVKKREQDALSAVRDTYIYKMESDLKMICTEKDLYRPKACCMLDTSTC